MPHAQFPNDGIFEKQRAVVQNQNQLLSSISVGFRSLDNRFFSTLLYGVAFVLAKLFRDSA